MGLRFQRRIRILPSITVNVSKSDVSTSDSAAPENKRVSRRVSTLAEPLFSRNASSTRQQAGSAGSSKSAIDPLRATPRWSVLVGSNAPMP